MMPLSFAQEGEEQTIQKIGGNLETKSFWRTWDLLSAEQ